MALSVVGCASVAPPPAPVVSHIANRNYEPGQPKTTNVGEAMVQVEDYYARTSGYGGWTATSAFSASNGFSTYAFQPGAIYATAYRRDIGGNSYDVLTSFMDPVLVDQTGRVAKVGAAMGPLTSDLRDTGNRLVRYDSRVIDTTMPFRKFELVYSGRTGDSIRIAYREYSPQDLARTAFFQELTYSVSESAIRFRDLEIVVSEATNSSISFVVR
nr:hypothetical protein [uncultured Brevundimonas sp.]